MDLENTFTIDVPIDEAWRALNDPELVAPCFPGAALNAYSGDTFAGDVKVTLGPISMAYKGEGTYVERDESNHRVIIAARGAILGGTAPPTRPSPYRSWTSDRTRARSPCPPPCRSPGAPPSSVAV
jgi:carbon monoxide dehydrogenase subunit G